MKGSSSCLWALFALPTPAAWEQTFATDVDISPMFPMVSRAQVLFQVPLRARRSTEALLQGMRLLAKNEGPTLPAAGWRYCIARLGKQIYNE